MAVIDKKLEDAFQTFLVRFSGGLASKIGPQRIEDMRQAFIYSHEHTRKSGEHLLPSKFDTEVFMSSHHPGHWLTIDKILKLPNRREMKGGNFTPPLILEQHRGFNFALEEIRRMNGIK